MTSKAVVVLSGGLDSSTLLHHVQAQGWDVFPISFDYGQRHRKELTYAQYQARQVEAHHEIVDMRGLTHLFRESGSSLVTGKSVPDGHYAEESMKATVVPNRNMIMLSIAAGYAVSIGADKIATGVHAGDHFIYPDCRPQFIALTQEAIHAGNEGFISQGFYIDTPFGSLSKNDIAKRAFDLNVDVAMTWSCYKGERIHCGRCGTCVERLEAIASTGHEDPTEYEDPEFFRSALQKEINGS